MKSFAPLIAPWFLTSSFLDGREESIRHHPITTPAISATFSSSSSSTSSTSSSISESYNNDYYIGHQHHHAVDHPIFMQDGAEFFPGPACSHGLGLYSPFVAPSLLHSLDVSAVTHQLGAGAPPPPPPPQQQQQQQQRPRAKSATHDSSLLEQHQYICQHPGCGKVFTRPYNLTSHMRTHTPERPYACSRCGRRFARQHDRNRHEKLHSNIKPYVCSNCSKPFARMDALNRHLRVENGCGSAVAAAAAVTTSNTLFVYHPTH